jgi:hypothetical protein
MSLTLVQNPDKDVAGFGSNVNAAITQLPYTFKREDFDTGNTADNGGNVQIDMTGASGILNAGESIYWNPDPLGVASTPYVAGVYVVLSVAANSFVIDLSFISPTTAAGYINLIQVWSDYSVQIKVEDLDNSVELPQVFVYRTSQAGNLFVDIGKIVTSYMENLGVTFLNYRILYRRQFGTNDEAYTPDVKILAILGERSIGRAGGSNYYLFLPNPSPLGLPFFTFAGNSKFWRGWKRTFSYIFDQNAAGRTGTTNGALRLSEVATDINGATIETIASTTSTAVDTVVTTLLTDDPNLDPQIHNYSVFSVVDVGGFLVVRVLLTDGDLTNVFAVGRLLTINGTSLGAVTAFAQDATYNIITTDLAFFTPAVPTRITTRQYIFNRVSIRNNQDSAPLSENKVFKYEKECANPIMIEWVDSFGVLQQYLFNISQDVLLSVTGELTYEPAIQQDIEVINRPLRRINADETLRLICSAENLTQADVRGLHELKTSEEVYAFLSKDGTDKIGVTINSAFETGYATEDKGSSFIVAVDFPQDYKFFDIKQY